MSPRSKFKKKNFTAGVNSEGKARGFSFQSRAFAVKLGL